VFLTVLLRSPDPIFISPHSVVGGERGTQVTHLYWEGSASQTVEEPHQERLTFPKSREKAAPPTSKFAVESESSAVRETEPGKLAGSPYGSLSEGTLSGFEVRPALPTYTYDPHIDVSELPAGFEGNIVVEITIDEQGNVVQEVVTQSIAPGVDAKVIAAVRNWHFRPATRDGVAIASKQDVYYHFPRR
jgi:TonB family protein